MKLTKEQKAVEAHCRKLAATRKGKAKRGEKTRIGGPYISPRMAEKFSEFSDHIGIHQTDILEGLLSRLLGVN